SKWILPERLYPWLGIASGLLVAGLGFTLFIRRCPTEPPASDEHVHDDDEGYRHSPKHTHPHAHAENAVAHYHTWWGGHVHEVDHHLGSEVTVHKHDRCKGDDRVHHDHHEIFRATPALSVGGLLALGITGGIVPCPAALVVLLGALAFHRVAFGLFLI